MSSAPRGRLLFLAFPFPPSRAIAAVRAWCLSKYLVRLGWDITVVTIDPKLLVDPDPTVDVAGDCRRLGIRRLLTGHGCRVLYRGFLKSGPWKGGRLVAGALRRASEFAGIDHGAGWHGPVLEACRSLAPGDVDLVLATGSPFVSFRLARSLGQKLGVPYVLDYRDLWSYSPSRRRPAGVLKRRYESRLLHGAACAVTVSSRCAESLQEAFHPARRPAVITNGFDPEVYLGVEPRTFDDSALVYAGTFQPGSRDVGPLLRIVMRANAVRAPESPPVSFRYFGTYGRYVHEAASDLGADSMVIDHGMVPRMEVLAALKGAAAAAVLTTTRDDGSLAQRGIVTGKLFEALGSRTRVMLIAPQDSEASKIVSETRCGASFLLNQADEAGAWLARLAAEQHRPDEERLAAYSWPMLAAKYDDLLVGCLERRTSR